MVSINVFQNSLTLSKPINAYSALEYPSIPKLVPCSQLDSPVALTKLRDTSSKQLNGSTSVSSERNPLAVDSPSLRLKGCQGIEMQDDEKTLRTESSRHVTGASQTVSPDI